ncbi:hypothetical protein QN277_001945 [Acacia crassicarpa]|uniref:Protein kinase domain-containing protein n=1 Tax=Acacia crassicarpa TaxID=499986 RepID=A0AAE1N854_9FABA|nr:hypothetical protein QN277_001945 [Acacia crassicarpa]
MSHIVIFLLGASFAALISVLVFYIFFYRKRRTTREIKDIENPGFEHDDTVQKEDLVIFQGGENLTICDILDAPGEVIGKSNYSTLYKALLQRCNAVRLLRFLRPVSTTRDEELVDVIGMIGGIRHPNLVPLVGFYTGPRGEKLLVHPFYGHGNLTQFIRDGNGESYHWTTVYRLTVGIAKGLEHLHTGLEKPMIHGNLKSKNILLDRNNQPCISDFALHLLLNPTAGQEMLEASAAQGYKAPELIKMKDVSEETDIYSLGVIMLELLSRKEPINEHPTPDEDFYLPNFMRTAVLGHRISDLYHPDILLSKSRDNGGLVSEECILKYFQLAMSCCSPSPSLRPNIKQVLWKLEEIIK